jgi:hypothetical protein
MQCEDEMSNNGQEIAEDACMMMEHDGFNSDVCNCKQKRKRKPR